MKLHASFSVSSWSEGGSHLQINIGYNHHHKHFTQIKQHFVFSQGFLVPGTSMSILDYILYNQ